MDIPHLAPLRQTAPQPVVADVAGEVRRQWRDSRVAGRIRRGDRVAVGVGSRGIANLAAIVRATLDVLRDLGAQPFVVAAMGSHGGATADGAARTARRVRRQRAGPRRAGEDRHDRRAASAPTAGASRSGGTRTPWRPTPS